MKVTLIQPLQQHQPDILFPVGSVLEVGESDARDLLKGGYINPGDITNRIPTAAEIVKEFATVKGLKPNPKSNAEQVEFRDL